MKIEFFFIENIMISYETLCNKKIINSKSCAEYYAIHARRPDVVPGIKFDKDILTPELIERYPDCIESYYYVSDIISYETFSSRQNEDWCFRQIGTRFGMRVMDDPEIKYDVKRQIAPYAMPHTIENFIKYPHQKWNFNKLSSQNIPINLLYMYCARWNWEDVSTNASLETIKATLDIDKWRWDIILTRFEASEFPFGRDEYSSIDEIIKYKHLPWDGDKISNIKDLTAAHIQNNCGFRYNMAILLKRNICPNVNIDYKMQTAILNEPDISMECLIKYKELHQHIICRKDFTVKEAIHVRNTSCASTLHMVNKRFKRSVEYWDKIENIVEIDVEYAPWYKIPKKFYVITANRPDANSEVCLQFLTWMDVRRHDSIIYKKKFLDLIIKNKIREPFAKIINSYIWQI